MLIATLHSLLPQGGPSDAPVWLHLVPAGTFKGADGRGPFHLADAQAVIAASMAGGQLAVDENHSTDIAAPAGQPSPARGWIVEMQARDDGLWGRVEWTDTGAALMADKAYRGISPVFTHLKDGTVTRVLRAALTNTPNLTQLATLHSEGSDMDITRLRAALGLPETADEAACLTAVTANRAAVASHATQLAAIASASGISSFSPETLVTTLQAERSRLVPMDQVIALQTQLDTLRAANAREAAVAFVDGAIRAGKPIVAVRDNIITLHMSDRAAAETMVNGMPSINAGGMPARHDELDDDADAMMSADDRAVCEKMGLDPKAYAKHVKKIRKGAAA